MTTTFFGLTPDTGESGAGQETFIGTGGFLGGGVNGQARGRYTEAGLTGNYSYPTSDDVDGFYVPRMEFKFFDAFGVSIPAGPTVRVRVPNQFNVTNFSDYSRTDAIFGAGNTTDAMNIINAATGAKIAEEGKAINDAEGAPEGSGMQNAFLKFGASSAEAFLYALQKSIGGIEGFLASGGLNAISQAEFSGRVAVNPYAQLLYKGPQFRRYQVPVLIRPRNATEAEAALNIIRTFKIASSPSISNSDPFDINGTSITLQSFTFGYPHLTQFSIDFKSPLPTKTISTIFESKLCAIESVATDFGGQKMNFFEDGIPTEITLTLQLSEIAVRTLGDARNDVAKKRTIV